MTSSNFDKDLLRAIIPEDIVQYAKLDLKTMKDIKNCSFSLHAEREAMASSHTFDIYSNNIYDRNDFNMEQIFTISIVDN